MMSSKQFCDQSLSGEQNTPGNITDRGHRSVNTGWQHSSDRTRILRGFLKLKIQIFVLRWEKEEKEALPLHRFLPQLMNGCRNDPTTTQVFFRESEARKVE